MKLWQRLTWRWTELVFGDRIKEASTPRVRVLRLLEEVLELTQAEAIPEADVLTVIRQVYDKPPGEPERELGGVMITAAGYADAAGYDLEEAFWSEFERIMDPVKIEKVRHRNLEGDKIGMRKPGE